MRRGGRNSCGALLVTICICWAGELLWPVQGWDEQTSGTYNFNISKALSGIIELTGSLSITGTGDVPKTWPVITSFKTFRHFMISGGPHTLSLQQLTLSPGQGGGGVVVKTGHLVIHKCMFTGNSAGEMAGGAIFMEDRGNLFITSSFFWGNDAERGGGIDFTSTGKLHIDNTTFEQNEAQQGGGGIFIDQSVDHIHQVTNTVFENNMGVYVRSLHAISNCLAVLTFFTIRRQIYIGLKKEYR